MTARNERVVRVEPGTASDRRDTAARRLELSPSLPSNEDTLDSGGSSLTGRGLGISDLELAGPSRRAGVDNSLGPSFRSSPGRSEPSPCRDPQSLARFHDVSLILRRLGKHRGALRLLSLIHFQGPITMYEMRGRVSLGQRALQGTLAVLLELQLIEPQGRQPFPYSRSKRFHLTERGRELLRTPIEEWPSLLQRWSRV